jgi:uncharacterized protein (TIGR02186 family)
MMSWLPDRVGVAAVGVAAAVACALVGTPPARAELWLAAQVTPDAKVGGETPKSAPPDALPLTPATPPLERPRAADGLPPEKVEADVSAHNIEVTSSFTGSEIVVFGSVDHSRQPTPESGYYDVAVVIQGPPMAVIARSKSSVGGLWVNTGSMLFDAVPSFYAVSTTRPLEEIAEAEVLRKHSIGFDHVRMRPRQGRIPNFTAEDLKAYKDAVVRLKQRDLLYPRQDFGVGFVGRSLFRTSIRLPANVPVASLQARVYLFREGALLSSYITPVKLERRGIEALIHDFATQYAFLYGVATVLLALGTGLAASMLFRRS